MTIEAVQKPSGVRTVVDAKNHKNKPSTIDGIGGGFGAILASQDTSETVGQIVIDPADTPISNALTPDATSTATAARDSQEENLGQSDTSSIYWSGMGLEPLGPRDGNASIETSNGKEKLSTYATYAMDALPVAVQPVISPLAVPAQAPMDATALRSQPSQWGMPLTPGGQRENGQSWEKVTRPVVRPVDAIAVPASTVEAIVETLGSPGALKLEIAEKSDGKKAVSDMVAPAVAGAFDEPIRNVAEKSKSLVESFGIVVETSMEAGGKFRELRWDAAEHQRGALAGYGPAVEASVETGSKSAMLQRDAVTRFALAGAALTPPVPVPAESAGQSESRALPLVEKIVEETFAPIAVTVFATNALGPVRREEQGREGSVFRSNRTEESTLSPTLAPSTVSASVQYTSAMQLAPEVFIAERVAYWISNDVQSAEMRLDGFGSDPVEVSIRMHGNEAYVAFRTDELQARAALENASTHLKELLQREGLVLTGVSVGNSGAGDSGDRQGRSRQGGRQTTIVSVTPALADRGVVAGRVGGGTLDLFV
jgi:flagellar hook-length control protein FliK